MRIDDESIVIGGNDDMDEMEQLARRSGSSFTKKQPEPQPKPEPKKAEITEVIIGGSPEAPKADSAAAAPVSDAPAAVSDATETKADTIEQSAAENAADADAIEQSAADTEIGAEQIAAAPAEEAVSDDEKAPAEPAADNGGEKADAPEKKAEPLPESKPQHPDAVSAESAAVVRPRDMAVAKAQKAASSILVEDASSGTGEADFRKEFLVTASPHIHKGETTRTLMQDVLIALLPAAITSVVYFGWRSAMLIAVCIASCVLTEYICRRVMKRRQTVGDFSAVVTGVLLAFCLPPELNPLYAVIGSVVAIAVVKQMFGGIGMNFANPAATARIVLMLSFPVAMTTYSRPFFYYLDATSGATPLAIINGSEEGIKPSLLELFLGCQRGCLGETCSVFLLLGGCYLLLRRVISWHIPVSFMGTVALIALIAGQNPLEHVLTGGVVLGAVFMATDYVTSPINKKGQIIYGIGCGLLTMMIRLFGSMTEGVSFAILLMNIITPHIERLTMPKPFGEEREAA